MTFTIVPKKLVSTDQGSTVYDKNGIALKKTVYVPVVYTLEEVLTSDASAEILKKYAASYEFTETESADRDSFTNITSRYDGSNKKLIYYIPAKAATDTQAAISESDKGVAVIRNKKLTDIEILKVDEKADAFDGAVFRLQKKEGSYLNIMTIKDGDTAKYPNIEGLNSDSTFTSGTTAIRINNLPDGEYQLVEDSTKPGYIIIHKEIQFIIENGVVNGTDIANTVKFEKANETTLAKITITNNPGTQLPQTGGSGTTLFTVLGGLMTVTAGAVLTLASHSRKRKPAEG